MRVQEASVAGTITTRDDRTVTVDVSWAGTGENESTSNTTTFPGFVGDGQTLVDGSTTNADIETLEDTNTTTGGSS